VSSCQYQYDFYFASPESHLAFQNLIPEGTSTEEIPTLLGFANILDEDSEHLEYYSLQESHAELSFNNSTSSSLNDALVRKFKDFGCEFCIVDIFNDQVGEGCKVYLHRGKPVSDEALDTLLQQYDVADDPEDLFHNDTSSLERALAAGLNVNKVIDEQPLLAIAYDNENKPAFDLLLKHGAAVDITNYDEPLLLHIASSASYDHLGFMQTLIKNGADYNQISDDGGSFLWHLGGSDLTLRKNLIEQNAIFQRPEDAYSDEQEPGENLFTAATHHDEEMISRYHEQLVGDPENHSDMAQLYSQTNRSAELQSLLDQPGFNKDSIVDLLSSAAECGSHTTVGTLLKAADQHSVSLTDHASDIINDLARYNNCFTQLADIAEKHPDEISTHAVSYAIAYGADVNLKILLTNSSRDNTESVLIENLYDVSAPQAQLLIDHGANPLYTEFEGQYLLTEAMHDDDEESSINDGVRSVLVAWLHQQSPEVATRHFLMIGEPQLASTHVAKLNEGDLDPESLQALYHKALESGAIDAISKLESLGASTDSDGDTPAIVLAVASNNSNTCRHLLQQGADANTIIPADYLNDDDEFDDEQVNELLGALGVKEGALDDNTESLIFVDTDAPGEGADCLMLAAIHGNTEIINLLIDAGADATRSDKNKLTALMYAAANGHADAVSALLAARANVEAVESRGNTALHYAAMAGSPNSCKLLINAGCKVDTQNTTNFNTPLSVCCFSEGFSESTLETLLNNDADINKKDVDGHSPLMLSCLYQNRQLTAFLLSKGADVNQVSGEAFTAYDLFKLSGRKAIGFSESDLLPTAGNIKAKKLLAKTKRFSLQAVIVAVVAAPVAYFSAIAGGVIAIAGLAFFVYREIKAQREYKEILESGVSISDNPMMTNFMSVMTNAQDMLAEEEARNQDIIDSWDDEDKAA
jgi:ankyrin repeat protein